MLKSAVILSAVFTLSLAGVTPLSQRECGSSYGCWSFPPQCTDQTCDGIVRWQHKGNSILFEWQAKDNLGNPSQGRYSSIGFSLDPYMGDDTVLECVFNGQGLGNVFVSFNGASSNKQLLTASSRILRNKSAALRDGKMICSAEFLPDEVKNLPDAERRKVHDLNAKSYMIQYAKGMVAPDGEKLTHSLTEGDEFYPWATTKKVQFCQNCPQKFAVITEMQQ